MNMESILQVSVFSENPTIQKSLEHDFCEILDKKYTEQNETKCDYKISVMCELSLLYPTKQEYIITKNDAEPLRFALEYILKKAKIPNAQTIITLTFRLIIKQICCYNNTSAAEMVYAHTRNPTMTINTFCEMLDQITEYKLIDVKVNNYIFENLLDKNKIHIAQIYFNIISLLRTDTHYMRLSNLCKNYRNTFNTLKFFNACESCQIKYYMLYLAARISNKDLYDVIDHSVVHMKLADAKKILWTMWIMYFFTPYSLYNMIIKILLLFKDRVQNENIHKKISLIITKLHVSK